MKEKDLSWIHFQEVMAAIQNFLDEEDSRESAPWNAAFSTPIPASFDPREKNAQRRFMLPIVQHYLSRQQMRSDAEALKNLPPDLFVKC